MTDLSYPTGRFTRPEAPLTQEEIDRIIDAIRRTPDEMSVAVSDLTDVQLDTPYRPDGWTVRQLVHHVADSHMNSMVRFKWGLTEDNPEIKVYDQEAWAVLPDSRLPAEQALDMLHAIHRRWVPLMEAMSKEDWSRTIQHPDWKEMRLDALAALYAWHGPHHVAHVTGLRTREGW